MYCFTLFFKVISIFSLPVFIHLEEPKSANYFSRSILPTRYWGMISDNLCMFPFMHVSIELDDIYDWRHIHFPILPSIIDQLTLIKQHVYFCSLYALLTTKRYSKWNEIGRTTWIKCIAVQETSVSQHYGAHVRYPLNSLKLSQHYYIEGSRRRYIVW